MRTYSTLILAAITMLVSGSLLAHHSFTAEFDRDKPITLTGIVYKVEWTNPHVWFYINVFDEDTGEAKSWGVELSAPSVLQRSGWGPGSLQIGQEVTVDGFESRSGAPRINSREVILTATGKRPGEDP